MKKGFTLVELLAVIVILSVVGIITIPLIGDVIEESRKKALEQSAYGLVEAANYYMIKNEGTYEFHFNNGEQSASKLVGTEMVSADSLDYKGTIDVTGNMYIDESGDVSFCLMDEKYYVYKNYNKGIEIGERKDNDCIVGYDAITNKYIAKLDDGTGISNVYSISQIDEFVSNLNDKIGNLDSLKVSNENKTNLVSAINETIETVGTVNTNLTSEIEAMKVQLGSLAPSVHTHDDRYYTETETDNLLANKMNFVYIGTGPHAGQNERRPSYDFTGAKNGLYLVMNYSENTYSHHDFCFVIKGGESISLMGNSNWSLDEKVLTGHIYSWYGKLNVWKLT